MDTPPDTPNADELNRLWQHALDEERLFHDRMNLALPFLSARWVEKGLQSVGHLTDLLD